MRVGQLPATNAIYAAQLAMFFDFPLTTKDLQPGGKSPDPDFTPVLATDINQLCAPDWYNPGSATEIKARWLQKPCACQQGSDE
jgi:hypothetical protein